MRKKQFRHLTGMPDILPKKLAYFEAILREVTSIANFYGFSKIETPILEEEELFIKGTGKLTEIVQKQMYSFKTKGKEKVVLRPEFTPSFLRAYIENGMEELPKPVKLWGEGPVFRYEKPQKGRLRQFHQFNFEIFGSTSPVSDALLIQVFFEILNEIGIKNWNLEVNSLGCGECQEPYLKILKRYFKERKRKLCLNCKKKIEINPLRIFDCKEEKCQIVSKLAPKILNYLCEPCQKHFKDFLEYLKAIKIPYRVNPYLARGLDYYQKIVFEFRPQGKKEKKDTIIAGGRYDDLIKAFNGKTIGALGGAGGIERIASIMKEEGIGPALKKRKIRFEEKGKVFLAHLSKKAKKASFGLLRNFRKKKIKVLENLEKDSLRSQLNFASRLGVSYVLILGEKEVNEGTIILRDMKTGIQKIAPQRNIFKIIKEKLK